jgi:hypothetical protein
MEKPPEKPPIKNLRDAYKLAGFRAQAKIDSYEHEPPALVITFDRCSKKRFAAAAKNRAGLFTTNAGAGRAISVAATGKFISISRCAA